MRKYHDPVTGIEETLVDPHKTLMVSKEQDTVHVTDLMPRTVYAFNISASFIDGSWGPTTSLYTETSSDGIIDLLILRSLRGWYKDIISAGSISDLKSNTEYKARRQSWRKPE